MAIDERTSRTRARPTGTPFVMAASTWHRYITAQ
jgi:hypothetical protein